MAIKLWDKESLSEEDKRRFSWATSLQKKEDGGRYGLYSSIENDMDKDGKLKLTYNFTIKRKYSRVMNNFYKLLEDPTLGEDFIRKNKNESSQLQSRLIDKMEISIAPATLKIITGKEAIRVNLICPILPYTNLRESNLAVAKFRVLFIKALSCIHRDMELHVEKIHICKKLKKLASEFAEPRAVDELEKALGFWNKRLIPKSGLYTSINNPFTTP
jgi:hypothetical protein